MLISKRGLVVLAMAGAIAIPATLSMFGSDASTSRTRPVTNPAPAGVVKVPSPSDYLTTQVEYYLTDEGIGFIRPGLKIAVQSITIGSDRKPVVELTFKDDYNQPLDRLGQVTPGAISASMILAWYNPETRLYTSYTTRVQNSVAGNPNHPASAVQASADSGGRWTDLELGRARYTFGTALPTGFDQTKTTTLGIYATRNLTALIGKSYYANVEHDFRPDGGTIAATAKWDKIKDGACLNCHDPLAIHGGSRRDVKLCVLCHSPQTDDPDTGDSVDMAYMVHKIHNGPNNTKPYVIIGNRNSVHDYSHVTYPQDIRNCDNCHEGINASQKPTQSNVWYTYPSRRACGACHDAIDFENGVGHPKQPDDAACANCHQPESEKEFDASIKGAHTIPVKSKQLKGINVQIVSVTNTKPGEKPTVVIKATYNDGTAFDWRQLSASRHPILAGPATSYTKYYREDARTAGVWDAAKGTVTYTFTNKIPDDAKGTWTISGDFRGNATIKDGQGNDLTVSESGMNPIKYFSVDASPVTPRRTSATIGQCNACHDRLALHGGQRLALDECIICHNPTMTDVAQRTSGTPASISMARMTHRIHTGHLLIDDYTIYGFGRTPHNYNEVLYPGDRRNCQACHTSSGYLLPIAKGADPVVTPDDYWSPQGPGTSACLGCHDSQDAAAHAYLNTANFPGSTGPSESCGACHGTNSTWSVDKVHAR